MMVRAVRNVGKLKAFARGMATSSQDRFKYVFLKNCILVFHGNSVSYSPNDDTRYGGSMTLEDLTSRFYDRRWSEHDILSIKFQFTGTDHRNYLQ